MSKPSGKRRLASSTDSSILPVRRKVKKKGKVKRRKLTEQEKEQNQQRKEIRDLLSNIGFSRVSYVDGKEFEYDGRTSELDDIFYSENVILLTEYTIGAGKHLVNKKIIYDKINHNPRAFIDFLYKHEKFKPFGEVLGKILSKYTLNQIQVKILYASKQNVDLEHKNAVTNVAYFDYGIVKYFEGISRVIKKSARFEFLAFLDIDYSKFGDNIKSSSSKTVHDFSGHILPEEHSSFKDGYKIVSFYIDAEALIRRAYVLRNDSWRNTDNIGLYQRMILTKKIKSMRKHLHESQRVFINNIIVTLPVERIKLADKDEKELKLNSQGQFVAGTSTTVTPATIMIEDKTNIIGIIDGQHRCFAYHEGDDAYEATISKLRGIQNLLVTGILYPKDEPVEKRLKFEAQLFLEINSNQSSAPSQLKQEIEFMMNPFSTISIAKHVINQLNNSGPLANMFEEHWYEKGKLKTATIISFGLRPLLKFDGNDSLFAPWLNKHKNEMVKRQDYAALKEYKDFCSIEVRKIFIALKNNVDSDRWKIDRSDPRSVINVTTVNGMTNCLRLLIENGKIGDVEYYSEKLKKIKGFDFKHYKSSQYRRMGQDIYNRCFE